MPDRTRTIACAALAVLLACPVIAQETNTGRWSAEIFTSTRDIWRGFEDRGPFLEFDATYTRGAWEFCTATSYELSPLEGRRQAEVDASVARRFRVTRQWSVVGGYQYYGTPQDDDMHAHELWTAFEYAGRRFDFSATAYQFVVPYTGTYLNLRIGRELYRRGRYSVRADAAIGFNRRLRIPTNSFSDATFTLTPAVQVAHGRIEPSFMFSKGLNGRFFAHHVVFGLAYVVGTRDGSE